MRSLLSESECFDLAEALITRYSAELLFDEGQAAERMLSSIQIALHAASAGEGMPAIRERIFASAKGDSQHG